MSRYKPIRYDIETFKKLLLSDAESQQEYAALSDEFALIATMLGARKQAKKTQDDVAAVMHTTSSAVSRLESIAGLKKHSPTLTTLRKYAEAVGCYLSIQFIPISKQRTKTAKS